jgi:hypothetical protein
VVLTTKELRPARRIHNAFLAVSLQTPESDGLVLPWAGRAASVGRSATSLPRDRTVGRSYLGESDWD